MSGMCPSGRGPGWARVPARACAHIHIHTHTYTRVPRDTQGDGWLRAATLDLQGARPEGAGRPHPQAPSAPLPCRSGNSPGAPGRPARTRAARPPRAPRGTGGRPWRARQRRRLPRAVPGRAGGRAAGGEPVCERVGVRAMAGGGPGAGPGPAPRPRPAPPARYCSGLGRRRGPRGARAGVRSAQLPVPGPPSLLAPEVGQDCAPRAGRALWSPPPKVGHSPALDILGARTPQRGGRWEEGRGTLTGVGGVAAQPQRLMTLDALLPSHLEKGRPRGGPR